MTGDPALRRALVIVNRHASRADGTVDDLLAILSGAGFALTHAPELDREAVAPFIRRHGSEVDCVVVGGGDGTLNAAAPALIDTGLPLGILPLGTANDLARTLDIPPDPKQAAAVIADRHLRAIDLGEVNGHPFFNVASLGLSVELARELSPAAKRRWGKLGYALTAVRVLSRTKPFSAVIEANGRADRVRTVQIAVGNGRFYGGGLTIAEDACADDGRLDVYSLEVKHWVTLAILAPALRSGRLRRWATVRDFHCEEITVRTRRPRSINTDGEVTTRTPAIFRVLPGAIRVFASPLED